MSRNSMGTWIGGSLLASFPRDFPRENEEESRESGGGLVERPRSAIPPAGDEERGMRRSRERERKRCAGCGSFLSRGAREMAPDHRGGTREKEMV